jgi:hypothetical protein
LFQVCANHQSVLVTLLMREMKVIMNSTLELIERTNENKKKQAASCVYIPRCVPAVYLLVRVCVCIVSVRLVHLFLEANLHGNELCVF